MSSVNLLSTKRLKAEFAEQLNAIGISLTEKDFIRVDPAVNNTELKKFIESINEDSYVIFTSSNAVEAVANNTTDVKWKVFCISGKTSEVICEKLKLSEVIATAESGAKLAKEIIQYGVKEVVFFSGDIRREELPVMLNDAGVRVEELVVYKTVLTPEKVNSGFDGVLFFSPSAVKSFFSVNQLSAHVICFAIGNTTAAEIRKFGNNKVIVAEKPTQESLSSAINLFYNQKVRL